MVVVLHGGPGVPGSAAGLARCLAGDFQVLEPLQRRSGAVPLSVIQHVKDLAVVTSKPAILIGWSWGAMLGLSFAAHYPEHVSDLVLIGCGTYDESSRALLHQSLDRRLGKMERHRIKDLQVRLASERDPTTRDAIFGEIGTAIMRAESYDLIAETAASSDIISPDSA
ncbi:MAG: alpha/beta hydrolase, partial [Thermoplasmata archaeon]|nr:alpha/beta hydrolase [Thermoplasmata archaeon]